MAHATFRLEASVLVQSNNTGPSYRHSPHTRNGPPGWDCSPGKSQSPRHNCRGELKFVGPVTLPRTRVSRTSSSLQFFFEGKRRMPEINYKSNLLQGSSNLVGDRCLWFCQLTDSSHQVHMVILCNDEIRRNPKWIRECVRPGARCSRCWCRWRVLLDEGMIIPNSSFLLKTHSPVRYLQEMLLLEVSKAFRIPRQDDYLSFRGRCWCLVPKCSISQAG